MVENPCGDEVPVPHPAEGRALYQCGAPQSRAWYEGNQEVYSGVPLGLITLGKGSLDLGG